MRIVHVASSLVRKSAGVREVILELSRAQRETGLDVAVLGLDHPDWEGEKNDWEGIPSAVSSVWGPRALGYAPQMKKTLKEMNPDIVHLHGLWMHPGRSVLQWHHETGHPYIISPHGMLSEVAISYSRLKKRVVSVLFQDAVFRHASSIHATCKAEADEIQNYGLLANTCVIPNGIAENAILNEKSPPGRTILSLGRIHRKKALDQLVLAWSKLEDEFPEWSLKIVGPDENGESANLAKLVEKTGLKRVSFHGPVYGADKIRIISSAGIFALPTRSENFALTVAESLMLGVPVVSSKGAPWAGLEKEQCGRWVSFGSNFMADALRELMLLTDDERREMGERGKKWMLRDFSWLTIAKRFQHHYVEILKGSI